MDKCSFLIYLMTVKFSDISDDSGVPNCRHLVDKCSFLIYLMTVKFSDISDDSEVF